MKRIILSWLLLISTFTLFANYDCAGNSVEFYKQTLRVEFDSKENAENAELKISEFPDGKKIGVSTRWDDSNPRHGQMAQMLNARGWKATCYLNGLSKQFNQVVKEMLATGNAIGLHTLSHPFLSTLNANEIFREIALQKIILESEFDTNVVSLALPYYNFSSPLDPNIAHLVGLSLLRSGCLSNPDIVKKNIIEKYSLASNQDIFSTVLFNADDRNPNGEIFQRELKKALKRIENGFDPHITLGVHTWQSDEGLQTLGKILDKYTTQDFWLCNENEYAAYRTQFKKTEIRKVSQNKNFATYEISRPATTTLGNDIALEISFSNAPKKVLLDDAEIKNQNGFYKLHQAKIHSSPSKIEHLSMPDNSGKTVVSKKFDGVCASMKIDNYNSKIIYSINNSGDAKITNIVVQPILPPCYLDNGRLKKPTLIGDTKIEAETKLVENKFARYFDDGNKLIALQIDFLYNGEPSRLYTSILNGEKISHKSDSPRDCAAIIGYFLASEITQDQLLNLSKKNTPLANIKGKNWEISPDKKLNLNCVKLSSKTVKPQWKDDSLVLCALDIIAPQDGTYTLVSDPIYSHSFYLNGESINLKSGENNVFLQKGKNRFLAAMKRGFVLICAKKHTNELKYSSPIFTK